MNYKIGTSELAQLLNLSMPDFNQLCKDAGRMYGKKKILKDNGEFRTIYPPRTKLRDIQRTILSNVLEKIPTHSCFAAGKGSSTKKEMKKHLNKAMMIRIDIRKFFPSVKYKQVFNTLKSLGFSHETAKAIVALTTYRGELPQGAPTSTQMARIVLNPAGKRICKLFTYNDVDITIWVDDIIISGPHSIKNAIPTITKILERFNFKVSEEKINIMPKTEEQRALGIRVDKKKLEPDSRFMKKFASAMANGEKQTKIKAMENYAKHIRKTE